MLQLQLRPADVIDQGDRPLGLTEKVDPIGESLQLRLGGSRCHLQVIQTTVRQTGQACAGEVAHRKIRMQPKTERHRLRTVVFDRGPDLQSVR